MRLTTKGRFAVTAMIDLGLRQSGGPVTLAAISQRQQISLSYLEQLFGKLRRHELVESTRGPGGGYTLMAARDAMITTGRVIRVSTSPPTSGAERGRPKKLMNTARPSRPNTMEGTAARLLMFTSTISTHQLRRANSSR